MVGSGWRGVGDFLSRGVPLKWGSIAKYRRIFEIIFTYIYSGFIDLRNGEGKERVIILWAVLFSCGCNKLIIGGPWYKSEIKF